MNLSGYVKRSLLVVLGFFALIGVAGSYWFYDTRIFKRNRREMPSISKKDTIRWLMEGAGIYFFNRYKPTWKKGVRETQAHKKEQVKLLHYKLRIEHLVDIDPTKQTNHNHPTIYLHGWGDTKHSAKLLKAFCDVLPGDIITFHFRDHGVLIPKFRYANLGQLPDVLSTIYTLKWTRDNLNPDAIDLFGYSRGGAALLNTIAVLNDQSDLYDTELEHLGVTPNVRKELLTLIQRGNHVLDCPLTDMNVTIREFIRHKTGPFLQSKTPFLMKLFQKITSYCPSGLQGITSAQSFAGLNLTTLVHFQHKDTIVSNANDRKLYKTLFQHNPKTTFLVLGNDGGHIHTHSALAHTIHTFKKRFGGSYDPEYALQYEATKHTLPIAQRLLQPGNHAKKIITDYYSHCTTCHKSQSFEKTNALSQAMR